MNAAVPAVGHGRHGGGHVVVERRLRPGSAARTRGGLLLVATLLALAIVEHWLLVLPWRPPRCGAGRAQSRPAPPNPPLRSHPNLRPALRPD
jgi:hypothetical protein